MAQATKESVQEEKTKLLESEAENLEEILGEADEEFDEFGEEGDSPAQDDGPFGLWSADLAEKKGLKVLLYGASGAGKTRMCATFPKPLFLDLESGLRTTFQVKPVLRYPANPKEEVESLEQVKEFYSLVKKTKNPTFETIVVDSLNELQVLVTRNVIGKFKEANRQYEDQMTQADYGKANRDFLSIIRLFLKLPYHIVFTAVETPREYPEQQVYPKFVGKQIGPDLQRIMEMIGYCHVVRGKDGTSQHFVSFKMSPTYIAKDRMGIVEKDIPNDFKYLEQYMNPER